MSTTINVTVDDGGLPAKNRQQTAANRQAFVQGQASQQAAQQGVDQRAADRRAAGLDPATGRPLASAAASSRLPRIEQEPAANRRGDDAWAMYFRSEPTFFDASSDEGISRWSATDILYRQRRPVASQPFYVRSVGDSGDPNPFQFSLSEAPGNTNAVIASKFFELEPGVVVPNIETVLVPFAPRSLSATLEVDIWTPVTYVGGIGITFYENINSDTGLPAGTLFATYNLTFAGNFFPTVTFRTTTDRGLAYEVNDTYQVMPPNEWARLAFVVDNGFPRLFVNGVLRTQVSNPASTDLTTVGAAYFGLSGNPISGPAKFNGLRVTPKALYSANYTPQPLRF